MANAIIDIAIPLTSLRLTGATDPKDFVMHAGSLIVTNPTNDPWITVGTDKSLNFSLAKAPSGGVFTLEFHVHDELDSSGNTVVWPNYSYGLQGIIYKLDATSVAGTPTSMPSRFRNVRNVGTNHLEVDYVLYTADLQYEYYLIIQNRTSGTWGLIDPRITTRP